MGTKEHGDYFPVGGLDLYYEVHGSDGAHPPVVLLHGGLTTIGSSFPDMLPALAKTRRVVAPEQQGHGHTADIGRPLSYEQMAEDTVGLLRHLGIESADLVGYSDGGAIALRIAIKYPQLVRRVAVFGASLNNEGLDPEIMAAMENMSPDEAPAELHDAYVAVAPDPRKWSELVTKVVSMAEAWKGWDPVDAQGVEAPVMVMVGDHDIVRPEHAAEMFRLFPHSSLAVLPATTHYPGFVERSDWVLAMVLDFLDGSPAVTSYVF